MPKFRLKLRKIRFFVSKPSFNKAVLSAVNLSFNIKSVLLLLEL